MRLTVDPPTVPDDDDDLDFRDEILGRMYDRGDPAPKRTLTFHIEVSDDGRTAGLLAQRRTISNWRRIGRIVFDEAVASYNGDFVVHFHHPPWRERPERSEDGRAQSPAGASHRSPPVGDQRGSHDDAQFRTAKFELARPWFAECWSTRRFAAQACRGRAYLCIHGVLFQAPR